MTRKEIARHDYKNGCWGTQTARLVRDKGGFILYNGWADGAWFVNWQEAKRAWREFLSSRLASVAA